jgi:adenosylhomocysteine nucleosidase
MMLVNMKRIDEMSINPDFVVLISANAEWKVVRNYFPDRSKYLSPYGECFFYSFRQITELKKPVAFFHGGWGKIAASASTQYAINRWHPRMVINLGTCGGFEGEIDKGEIILVEKTIIYDIFEQMGDPDEHIKYYSTDIDTTWLNPPLPLLVKRTLLVSGDRDLFYDDILMLKLKYSAIAGDWESGAIAWVANKNHTPCLILRGVTDLVGESGGEAYDGNVSFYDENTELIMKKLLESLPQWLLKYTAHS